MAAGAVQETVLTPLEEVAVGAAGASGLPSTTVIPGWLAVLERYPVFEKAARTTQVPSSTAVTWPVVELTEQRVGVVEL